MARGSDGLPSFAEYVVDELGHGFGSAGAPPAFFGLAADAGVVHHLGEHQHDFLVVLGCRELVELAVELGGQPLAVLPAHLPRVAQVLLVAHQEDQAVRIPFGHSQVQLSDKVYGGFGRQERGAVADVVDHQEPVCPVDLVVQSGLPLARLGARIIKL